MRPGDIIMWGFGGLEPDAGWTWAGQDAVAWSKHEQRWVPIGGLCLLVALHDEGNDVTFLGAALTRISVREARGWRCRRRV